MDHQCWWNYVHKRPLKILLVPFPPVMEVDLCTNYAISSTGTTTITTVVVVVLFIFLLHLLLSFLLLLCSCSSYYCPTAPIITAFLLLNHQYTSMAVLLLLLETTQNAQCIMSNNFLVICVKHVFIHELRYFTMLIELQDTLQNMIQLNLLTRFIILNL